MRTGEGRKSAAQRENERLRREQAASGEPPEPTVICPFASGQPCPTLGAENVVCAFFVKDKCVLATALAKLGK